MKVMAFAFFCCEMRPFLLPAAGGSEKSKELIFELVT